MELDYTQITAVLSYKPGWFYSYEPGVRDKVIIHAKVEDSHHPGVMVNFKMGRIIPTVVRNNSQAFIDWVHDITIEAEIHETNEFFRFAGELLYDPHRTTPVGAKLKSSLCSCLRSNVCITLQKQPPILLLGRREDGGFSSVRIQTWTNLSGMI